VPEDHVSILRRAYAALAEGDASAGLELLADDFVWLEPRVRGYPLGGEHHGRDGFVRGILRAAPRFWDEIRVEPDAFLGAEDHVVVTGRLRGRVKGGSSDIATDFAHVWTLAGGRPVRGQSYADMTAFVAEKGLHDLVALADGLIEHATALDEQWAELAAADSPSVRRAARSQARQRAVGNGAARGRTDEGVRTMLTALAVDGRTREEARAELEQVGVQADDELLSTHFRAGEEQPGRRRRFVRKDDVRVNGRG
jgi:ketosteroid isomerase-like protein